MSHKGVNTQINTYIFTQCTYIFLTLDENITYNSNAKLCPKLIGKKGNIFEKIKKIHADYYSENTYTKIDTTTNSGTFLFV